MVRCLWFADRPALAPAARVVTNAAQLTSAAAASCATPAGPSLRPGSPDGRGIECGAAAPTQQGAHRRGEPHGGEAAAGICIAARLLQDGDLPHRRRTKDCISELCAAELLNDDSDDIFTAAEGDGLPEGAGPACPGPGLTAAPAKNTAPQLLGSRGGSGPVAAAVEDAVTQLLWPELEGGSCELADEGGGDLGEHGLSLDAVGVFGLVDDLGWADAPEPECAWPSWSHDQPRCSRSPGAENDCT